MSLEEVRHERLCQGLGPLDQPLTASSGFSGNPRSRSLGLLAAKLLSSLSYWVPLMCPGPGYTLGTTSELYVVPAQGIKYQHWWSGSRCQRCQRGSHVGCSEDMLLRVCLFQRAFLIIGSLGALCQVSRLPIS